MGWEMMEDVDGPETPVIIIGVSWGGPWPVKVVMVEVGGMGLLAVSRSVGMVGILGIILAVLRDFGPGGLPGPGLAPLGDIFCLDLGLGWLGVLATGPVKPILGPDWVTVGSRGAMALEMAVLPGGGPVGMPLGLGGCCMGLGMGAVTVGMV
jgi:hypothetical protein